MILISKYTLLFSLILATSFEGAWGQDFSPVVPGQDGIPDARWPSLTYNTIDRKVSSAEFETLRDKELSPNEKEIRVWIGGGFGAPEFLFLFRKKKQVAEGTLHLFWRSNQGNRPEGETFHDLMMYSYTGQCENFRLKSEVGTCEALFTKEPDWEKIFEKITDIGIWELPDASKYDKEPEVLEDGSVVINIETDGRIITVELHDGQDYRSYQYSNPQSKDWPEAKKILQIEKIVNSIKSDLKSSAVTKNYKGITQGYYKSAFNVCESNEIWEFRAAGNIESLARRAELELPEPGRYGYLVEVLGAPSPEWLASRRESEFVRILQPRQLKSVKPAERPNCK